LEDEVTADVKSNTMSWQPRFNSYFLSGIKIIQKAWPKTPLNGLISSFLVLLTMIRIITILAGIKCSHILELKASTLTLASKGATGIIPFSEGVTDCISLSSKGDDIDFDTASYSAEDFECDIEYPLCSLHGFTSFFADGDLEMLNTQIHFDTDSVFFVCDNSTTGHICNNIWKFIPGSFRQTNKSLTTANGTGPCLQEGMV
jgi:hypothetical protein